MSGPLGQRLGPGQKDEGPVSAPGPGNKRKRRKGMHLKPQEVELLRFLRKRRSWTKVRDLLNLFPSNSPTRRISALHKAGKIEKRRYPFDTRYVEYRAKEMTQ
jgi:hypothetical protein